MMNILNKRRINGDDVHADRVSDLPEPIIQHIQSFLPLKDAARNCVLSKTWNRVCNLYPILYLDYTLYKSHQFNFLPQKPNNEIIIQNSFMDFVDHHLLRVTQQNLPIKYMTLNWCITDGDYNKCFGRVDQWIELLVNRASSVKELCLAVEYRYHELPCGSVCCYKLQRFRVFAIKGLQCLTLRLCEFNTSSNKPDNNVMVGLSFGSSLKQLRVSKVMLSDNDLDCLTRCCPVIEVLEFESCHIQTRMFELSRFSKSLKRFSWVGFHVFTLDIRGTTLESLRCDDWCCRIEIDKSACATIRELAVGDVKGWDKLEVFQDIATTFPLLEEAQINTTEILPISSRLLACRVAKHYHLRTLCIDLTQVKNYAFGQFRLIDCPNLTSLTYNGDDSDIYIESCPNLREIYYKCSSAPTYFTIKSAGRLEKIKWEIPYFKFSDEADVKWFLQLKEVIQQINPMTSNPQSHILSQEVDFILKELVQEGSSHSINLAVEKSQTISAQNQAGPVDGLLGSTRSATLTVDGKSYDFVKKLCEPCCEKQLREHCCHHIKDFEVEIQTFNDDNLEMEDIYTS